MTPLDLKMETQAVRPHRASQNQHLNVYKVLKRQKSELTKAMRSWRPHAAFKTQLNQKNMLSMINTPHHYLSELALPKTTENI